MDEKSKVKETCTEELRGRGRQGERGRVGGGGGGGREEEQEF